MPRSTRFIAFNTTTEFRSATQYTSDCTQQNWRRQAKWWKWQRDSRSTSLYMYLLYILKLNWRCGCCARSCSTMWLLISDVLANNSVAILSPNTTNSCMYSTVYIMPASTWSDTCCIWKPRLSVNFKAETLIPTLTLSPQPILDNIEYTEEYIYRIGMYERVVSMLK